MQITVHCVQKGSTNKSPDKWAIMISKLELPLAGRLKRFILCKDSSNVQSTKEDEQLLRVGLTVFKPTLNLLT